MSKNLKITVGILAGCLALVLAIAALWQFVLKDSPLFTDSDQTDDPNGVQMGDNKVPDTQQRGMLPVSSSPPSPLSLPGTAM